MSKMNKILIGIVALVLVFVIAFVGVLLWMRSNSSGSEHKKEVEKPKTTVHMIEESIVTNLVDSANINIRVAVSLEWVADKTFDEELKENDGLATTVIITALRGKKVREVSEPDAPMKIREEIVKDLNKAYHTDKFVEVYFKEFIVQ